jgi:2-dehydropantoate 2-reductase
VGNDRLGALLRHRFVRRLALETMTEVVSVAKAEGVALEKVSGTLDLDWLALSDDERLRSGSTSLLAKHTVLLAVGTKYRNMRSSMLRAIDRGRKPPVDFLNGEIVDRAVKHGIQAPINQALQDAVWLVSDKELTNSLTSLKTMYDHTRDTLRELDMVA